MDSIRTEKLITNGLVYDPKLARTFSSDVSKELTIKISTDTLKIKSENIFGEVPVKKQIVLADSSNTSGAFVKDAENLFSKGVKVSKKVINSPLVSTGNNGPTDTSKDIMQGASIAADGFGAVFEKFDFLKVSHIDALNVFHWNILDGVDLNFLDGIDVLGVQTLKLAATGLRLGVNYKDLKENLKKDDDLNSAWAITGMAKGTWGLVVGALKTAEASTSLGANMGFNSLKTAAYVESKSLKINDLANKIAVPFAIATTGLHIWDFIDDKNKVSKKEKELDQEISERKIVSKNIELVKKPVPNEKEVKIKNEISVLNTNANIMGVSVGFSAVSTLGLISSVVFPQSAKIATPVFMVGNVLASVTRTFSDDKVRTKISDTYDWANYKYHQIDNDVIRFLTLDK